ncbi:MAG: hypothetical protein A2Z96_01620 [Spirochaetes bacterium GWB1_48_6]|nr:MAG: hypothetical protein A2Z96_01620 [Spirochaetes bacterium GWB1_48_6]
MANTNVSLRFSLSSAFVMVVLLTSLTLGTVTYFSVRMQLRDSLRQRLGDVAAAASLNISAQEHAGLKSPEDMKTPVYEKYRVQFAKLRAVNPDIRFLYTLRKTQNDGLIFVLDSGETEEDYSPLGMDYESPSPALNLAFQKPYGIQVESEFLTDQWGTWLSSFAPILDDQGNLEGVLGLDMSATRVSEYELKMQLLIALICFVVSVLGALMGIFFSRRISKPLLGLAKEMGRIQQFILDEEGNVHSRIREVRVMSDSLINMKKGLRSFKKYVPSDVVAQLISLNKEAVLETAKVPLTIFFSDLENFTGLSESLSPEKLAEVLGGYFHIMTSTLQNHKATVDKFIGDSVMAFWNAPAPLEDHAYWACKGALACQQALRNVSEEWKKNGLPVVKTRMGINTGISLVGNIGYNQRLSYTALGDPVNLASRLESLNKYYGTSILLGEDTYKAVEGRMQTRLVDLVAVKGRTKSTGIYELLTDKELPKGWPELLEAYNKGLDAYFKQNWPLAQSQFEKVLSLKPADGPSTLLLKKIQGYILNPPGTNWDGSTVMNEK